MNPRQPTERYQLSTDTDGLGWVPDSDTALRRAAEFAGLRGQTVRIYDKCAHYGDTDLWEVREGECFTRVLRIKRRKVA